ncbi:hypothetical protein DFJ73DRAFT_241446 [Zopfochytrium polystomum]|nr:hypothetical protein DFJ73DRAFT_241446 [Zopfochytrium polystomum]
MATHGERRPRTQQITSAVSSSLFPASNLPSHDGRSQPVHGGYNDTNFQLRAVASTLRASKPTLKSRVVTPSANPQSTLYDVQPIFTQHDGEEHPRHAKDPVDARATTNGLNRRWCAVIPIIQRQHDSTDMRNDTRSCEICRKRKLKCNGNRPSCSFCSRRCFDCVYLGTKTRSEHDTQAKYRAELERRKKRRTLMLAKRVAVPEWAPG